MDLPLTELRSYLGMSSTASDVTLTRLLEAAVKYIEEYTGLGLSAADYSETYDGDDGVYLSLDHAPVNSVSSLTVCDDTISATTAWDTEGYFIQRNALKLIGYRFTRGFRTVEVTYNAGYSTVPFDLVQAVIELAASMFEGGKRVGQKSKQIQSETVSFHDSFVTPSVLSLLNQYRRQRV